MKNHLIFAPVSPSKFISKEEFNVTFFFITFGGGMGGGNRSYYAKEVKDLKKDNLIELKLIDGTTTKINKNFLVETKEMKVVQTTHDVTAHANFHKTTCKSAITTRMILMELNDTYTFDHSYGSSNNLKIIFSETKRT